MPVQESYVEQFRRILAAKNAWREDMHGGCCEELIWGANRDHMGAVSGFEGDA